MTRDIYEKSKKRIRKAAVIRNDNRYLAENMETPESDGIPDIVLPSGPGYAPIDKGSIKMIEVQRIIEFSPPWLLGLQETIKELTIKIDSIIKKNNESLEHPKKIFSTTIYDLNSPKYELAIPIQVTIEEYEDETIARIPELNIFTSSETDTEAIFLLKDEILALYKDLLGCENLGPLPNASLETLNKLLVKKS
jgi:hypothetical protein